MSSEAHHGTGQTSQDPDQGSGRVRHLVPSHPSAWVAGSDGLPSVGPCRSQGKRDRQSKVAAVKLLPAFAIALKLHLRSEPVNAELEANLSSEQFNRLKTMNHPPLEIAFWISSYLQEQAQQDKLDRYQLSDMVQLLNYMIDVAGICERILRTPIPLAYSIHLKQLLMIYSLSLPFQMVDQLEWMTGPIVALISFTLLGIEEIGIQIEDPFGHDANDLPLDNICNSMMRNIEDLLLVSNDKESAI